MSWQSQVHICNVEECYLGCGCVDCINGKSVYHKKDLVEVDAGLDQVSLRDVPLEVRRKEAKKPLFLKRYE